MRVKFLFFLTVSAALAMPLAAHAELAAKSYAIGRGSDFTGNFLLLADPSTPGAPQATTDGSIETTYIALWETLPQMVAPIGFPTDVGNCIQVSANGKIESTGAPCGYGDIRLDGADGNVAMFYQRNLLGPVEIADTGFAAADVVLRINPDANWELSGLTRTLWGTIPMLGWQTERLISSRILFGQNLIGRGTSGFPDPSGGPLAGCLELVVGKGRPPSYTIQSTGSPCTTSGGGLSIGGDEGNVVKIAGTGPGQASIMDAGFSASSVALWNSGNGSGAGNRCVEVNSSGKLIPTGTACNSSPLLLQSAINTGTEETIGGLLTGQSADIMRGKITTATLSGTTYSVPAAGFERGNGARVMARMPNSASPAGAVYLNVNATGATAIAINNSTSLPAGALKANGAYMFVYDNSMGRYYVLGDNYSPLAQSDVNTGTSTVPRTITAQELNLIRGKFVPTAATLSSGVYSTVAGSIDNFVGGAGSRAILKMGGTNIGSGNNLNINGTGQVQIRVAGANTTTGVLKQDAVYMFVREGIYYHAIGMDVERDTLNTLDTIEDCGAMVSGSTGFWTIPTSPAPPAVIGSPTTPIQCRRSGDVVTVTIHYDSPGTVAMPDNSGIAETTILTSKYKPLTKTYCTVGKKAYTLTSSDVPANGYCHFNHGINMSYCKLGGSASSYTFGPSGNQPLPSRNYNPYCRDWSSWSCVGHDNVTVYSIPTLPNGTSKTEAYIDGSGTTSDPGRLRFKRGPYCIAPIGVPSGSGGPSPGGWGSNCPCKCPFFITCTFTIDGNIATPSTYRK